MTYTKMKLILKIFCHIIHYEYWSLAHAVKLCLLLTSLSLVVTSTMLLQRHHCSVEWRLISATLCGWRRCFVAD